MPRPKSPELDDILSKPAEDESARYDVPAARKPTSAKPVRPGQRNAQAWRAIEDMKATRRLDRGLKEVYEDE